MPTANCLTVAPIAGQADYTDDFLFPRFNPDYHPHQGNDIFAKVDPPAGKDDCAAGEGH